jgi:hypothetical protein
MMWYSLCHDNEFMYEMVICCNVKWPARHGMMAGAMRLPPYCIYHRDRLQVMVAKCTRRTLTRRRCTGAGRGAIISCHGGISDFGATTTFYETIATAMFSKIVATATFLK